MRLRKQIKIDFKSHVSSGRTAGFCGFSYVGRRKADEIPAAKAVQPCAFLGRRPCIILLFVTDAELISMLGNLPDNAIRAAAEIVWKEEVS